MDFFLKTIKNILQKVLTSIPSNATMRLSIKCVVRGENYGTNRFNNNG